MHRSKLIKSIFSILVFAGLVGFKFLSLNNSGDPTTISIDGFNPAGMTKDEIKTKIDSKKNISGESDTKLKIEDGDYYCTYNFDASGVLNTVDVVIPGIKLKTSN
ncbi:hypothetical protein [uncultured Clostridium sp.]|uniref:hypothetical protein n=1 Tax=uncultured Clostridium sp. TaxID=59620 RepID=UPI0025DC9D17|nr:hypothetical protein [uncultured Clostridium sp.]